MTAGLIALVVAIVPALMMALQHFAGIKLPGCGEGSPCAAAAGSMWGKIPLPGTDFTWPVSFVGLAFFLAILVTWIIDRGRLTPGIRWLVRLGGVVSCAYLIVIFAGGYLCPYCIASHIGNLAFWFIVERSTVMERELIARQPMVAACVFAVATAALCLAELQHRRAAAEVAEQQRQDSTQQIIAQSADAEPDQPSDDSPYSEENPFTGRWHIGPQEAPLRLVVYSDYQCIDCKRVEGEIRQLVQQRTDINLSVKQFPFCRPCNRFVTSDMHPNACWAARAAETAGMIGGTTAFWEMHHWLFDKGGGFTDAELRARLATTGYKVDEFVQKMASDELLQRVQGDVEEAVALGIHFTPMIFINGVEFKGWSARGALARTIDEVARTNPPPRGPQQDRPPLAARKLIEDWRDQPSITLPPDTHVHALGAESAGSAAATIVMWGDYEDKATMEADAVIRSLLAQRPEIRYEFRHYPVDLSCNPHTARTAYPNACRMAHLAEAAGALAGEQAYWRMHEWLLANQKTFSDDALREAQGGLDLDLATLLEALDAPDVTAAVQEDCIAANQLNPRFVPLVYVNGKFVPRWRLEGHEILKQIVDEAAGDG